MSATGKALDITLLRRVLRYVGSYKLVFYTTLFLTVFLAVLGPVRPMLIQYTLDNTIISPDPTGLGQMMVLLIILLLLQAVIQYFQMYWANWLGQTVIKDLRVDVYRHVTGFKLKYFDNTPIGAMVTRVVSDVEAIAQIFSEGLLTIIGDLLTLIVVIVAMFWVDVKLTLFVLVPVPVLVISTYIFKNAIKSSFQEVRRQISNLNTFVQEHITGMNIIQIFNRENQEFEKFKEINMKHTKAHLKSVMAYSIFLPVVEILSAVSVSALIWWGAKEVINGYSEGLGAEDRLTPGKLVEFLLFVYMLYRPIRQLADRFNTLQMGIVSSERVFKVLDTDEVIRDNSNDELNNVKGEIEFKDVWFAYKDDDWVIKNLSFKVEAGETLAIVGATGSGKTTIINLLGRFYELNKGNINIDGSDIASVAVKSLRQNVAVVLQDVFLFSDSIYNNVTLKNEEISLEQVKHAAEIVGADRFIEQLPGKYEYNVRERGAMLSVGQRQLLAFIRAYVNDPKILILDEATSSVDTESEEMIQHAISKLTENRTSIIVAHRLATITNADKILVMEHGEMIEFGTHDELITKGGQYAKLFEMQFS